MSAEHIRSMRLALLDYNAQAVAAHDKIKLNEARYREDIAAEENAKLRGQLRAARQSAEAAIKAAADAGRAEAESWGRMDGNQLTKDAELLRYDLTPEQFADIAGRYTGNSTMSALLRQYGDRKNKEASADGHAGIGPYDVSGIPSREDKLQAYDRFQNSALDLVARLDQENTLGGGTDSPMLQAAIKSFGEPSVMNERLFQLL